MAGIHVRHNDNSQCEEQKTDLLPALYNELRKLAAIQMARQPYDSTLQPTALVHEAWLKLGSAAISGWRNQTHFFASTAQVMRHILVDRARRRSASRHGGGKAHVNVDDIDIPDHAEDDELLALDEAVERLTAAHPEMAELVKLRCFGGLEVNQAALALGISRATANRWWLFARTWLYREIKGTDCH